MKIDLSQIKDRLESVGGIANKYAAILFLVFLLAIYGFLTLRVVSLTASGPDEAAVSAKLKTAGVPHIDADALAKIQQLQDNSVQVQTLFDQARGNPFQEQ